MKKSLSLILCLFGLLWAPLVGATAQFPLNNAIGVAVTPKGQEYFKTEILTLIEANNYQIDDIYFPGTEIIGEELATEDLVEDPELKEVIFKAKEVLNRFFEGLDIDRHQLALNVEDIYFQANWEEISLNILKPTESELEKNYQAIFVLNLRSSNINVEVTKVRGKDLNNEWLGELGVDHFNLFTDRDSAPLQIQLALGFNQVSRGNFKIEVLTPQSNLNELLLGYRFDSPLVLPQVEVQINERKLRLRNEEIEALLLEEQENILNRVKSVLQEKIETEIPVQASSLINDALNSGLKEVNQMNPPGAPDDKVAKFVWALSLGEVKYQKEHLILNLDARFDDPTLAQNRSLPTQYTAATAPSLTKGSFPSSDFVFSLNQSVLNRVIQLSSLRGYFDEIAMDSGESIKLVKTPYLSLKDGKAKMALEIEYEVTGFSAVFVKNPIRIEFDLNLAFPIDKDGKVSMQVESIDVDSSYVDSKYIRLFSSKVRSAVKDKLKEVNEDMKGYLLTDDIPIPDDLGGIKLRKVGTELDNGHLLIYSEYKN